MRLIRETAVIMLANVLTVGAFGQQIAQTTRPNTALTNRDISRDGEY